MTIHLRRGYITTKSIFFITLLVATLTVLSVWLFGLDKHRTLFVNAILSASILSLAFFSFLSINLYRGIKMKDDLGKITDNLSKSHFPNLSEGVEFPSELPDVRKGDDCGGIVLGIILWILIAILFVAVIWFFGALLWSMILIFAAMLYWIFFRALRLVFKSSNACKDNLSKSLRYGFAYTLLYNFWIYGIILSAHYLI